jgi:hypothetical protein
VLRFQSMDVFVIPVSPARAPERYELYCELPDEALDVDDDGVPASQGLFRSLWHKFRMTLRRVERERHQPPPAVERRSWSRRTRDRAMRWLVERIAEQRLLWYLRRQERVTAIYPADVTEESALAIIRRNLKRDADRHLRWLVVDALLFLLSGVFFFVPGPNIIAYYFGFRVVGHFLSLRGARQGLLSVTWTLRPSTELAELRRVITLPADARARQVRELASRLRLEHLTTFFERVTVPSA